MSTSRSFAFQRTRPIERNVPEAYPLRKFGVTRTSLARVPAVTALVVSALTFGTGCVKKELYTQALADLQFERNRSTELERKLQVAEAEVVRLEAELKDRDGKLEACTVSNADLARKLDEVTVLNVALSDRLKSAGQSLDQLSTEKGSLAAALSDTRKQLEELKKQQAAAEARVAQFQDLIRRFQKLVDAGKLKVAMRQGRMIVELPTDVLFDSGRSEVRSQGRDTIGEVGKVLATLSDRRFQVAGHTDDVGISTPKFPSNWELSTARAVEVVKILVDVSKMKPENLSAAGYGPFDPLAPNDSDANKQKNRRIEISLVPNLEEFVGVPASGTTTVAPAAPARPAATK